MKVPRDHRLASSRSGSNAMMIGMDGTVLRSNHYGHSHHSSSSHSYYDEDDGRGEITAIAMDGTVQNHVNMASNIVSSQGGGSDNDGNLHRSFLPVNGSHDGGTEDSVHSSSDEHEKQTVLVRDMSDSNNGRRRCFLLIVSALIIATIIGLTGYFTSKSVYDKKHSSQQVSSVQQESSENYRSESSSPCEPGMIKDTKEPMLELYMAGPTQLVTDDEKKVLEQAILAGFNEASGGCTDLYERWMYGVQMVNQTILRNVGLVAGVGTNTSDVLENHFEDEHTFVARFQTIISCNGCSEDSAFASEYPTSFGTATMSGSQRRLMREFGRHRASVVSSNSRGGRVRGDTSFSRGSVTTTGGRNLQEGVVLSADKILVAIENSIVDSMDTVEAVLEAKIVTPVTGETYELGNTRQSRNSEGGGKGEGKDEGKGKSAKSECTEGKGKGKGNGPSSSKSSKSCAPSNAPSATVMPSAQPSTVPSVIPSTVPSVTPSLTPSSQPSIMPSMTCNGGVLDSPCCAQGTGIFDVNGNPLADLNMDGCADLDPDAPAYLTCETNTCVECGTTGAPCCPTYKSGSTMRLTDDAGGDGCYDAALNSGTVMIAGSTQYVDYLYCNTGGGTSSCESCGNGSQTCCPKNVMGAQIDANDDGCDDITQSAPFGFTCDAPTQTCVLQLG